MSRYGSTAPKPGFAQFILAKDRSSVSVFWRCRPSLTTRDMFPIPGAAPVGLDKQLMKVNGKIVGE